MKNKILNSYTRIILSAVFFTGLSAMEISEEVLPNQSKVLLLPTDRDLQKEVEKHFLENLNLLQKNRLEIIQTCKEAEKLLITDSTNLSEIRIHQENQNPNYYEVAKEFYMRMQNAQKNLRLLSINIGNSNNICPAFPMESDNSVYDRYQEERRQRDLICAQNGINKAGQLIDHINTQSEQINLELQNAVKDLAILQNVEKERQNIIEKEKLINLTKANIEHMKQEEKLLQQKFYELSRAKISGRYVEEELEKAANIFLTKLANEFDYTKHEIDFRISQSQKLLEIIASHDKDEENNGDNKREITKVIGGKIQKVYVFATKPTKLAILASVVMAEQYKHLLTQKGNEIYSILSGTTIRNPANAFEVDKENNHNVNIMTISNDKIREKIELIIKLISEDQTKQIQIPIWKALMIDHKIGEYANKSTDYVLNNGISGLNTWIFQNNIEAVTIEEIVQKLKQEENSLFLNSANNPEWIKIRDGKVQVLHSNESPFTKLKALIAGENPLLSREEFAELIISAKQLAVNEPNQDLITKLYPNIREEVFIDAFKKYLIRCK